MDFSVPPCLRGENEPKNKYGPGQPPGPYCLRETPLSTPAGPSPRRCAVRVLPGFSRALARLRCTPHSGIRSGCRLPSYSSAGYQPAGRLTSRSVSLPEIQDPQHPPAIQPSWNRREPLALCSALAQRSGHLTSALPALCRSANPPSTAKRPPFVQNLCVCSFYCGRLRKFSRPPELMMDWWHGRPRGVGFYPPLAEVPSQIKDQRTRANCNWS